MKEQRDHVDAVDTTARPRGAHAVNSHAGQPTHRRTSLDDVDLQIVALLARDPRISARAIARRIGVAPGTVGQRIARLAERSIISGYQTVLGAESLGYDVHAMLGLQTDQGPLLDDAIAELLKLPEVVSIHIVTGQWDLLAELRLRDHSHLLDVLRERIYSIPGFRHVQTMISLRTYSRPGGWVPAEFQGREP